MTGPKPPEPEARTELRVMRRVVLRKLPSLIPYFGKVADAAFIAERETREERKRLWSEWLVASDDSPEVFADRVAAALEGREDKVLREAINESIRAALDAMDEIVIPSVALLTRKYLEGRANESRFPDRRTYRECLELLRSLDGDEFLALRYAVTLLAWMDADPIATGITNDPGNDVLFRATERGRAPAGAKTVWVWYTTAGKEPLTELVVGDLAPRIVSALQPLQGGGVFASFAPPHPGPDAPRFSRALMQLLAEVMQLPEPLPEPAP
jgi:hypothetical protein